MISKSRNDETQIPMDPKSREHLIKVTDDVKDSINFLASWIDLLQQRIKANNYSRDDVAYHLYTLQDAGYGLNWDVNKILYEEFGWGKGVERSKQSH